MTLPAHHRVGKEVGVSTGKTLGTPGSTAAVGNFLCREPVQLHL
ncbi:MAG: hypothetical protein ACRC33_06850 [Gemmataceae bacterium]